MIRWMLAAAILLSSLGSSVAADVSKVDRSIGKEPKYAGKPGYCLVVFGPEAAFRIWLIRDGDTLYADKNGNGDLTEPGEQIAGEKNGSGLAFHIGTLRAGKLEHRNVSVRASALSGYGDLAKHPISRAALQKDKDVDLMSVNAEVEAPGLKGDGDDGRLTVTAQSDSAGPLLFADTPANAPVPHFGGPLHLCTESARPTLYRNVVHDLMLAVGTPGIGPGTFAHVSYENLVPETAFIVVNAEFLPGEADAPPIKQRFELKERC